MLFDLRSPHRRRVIKVVYVFLAVLIGGGLIFFGIGNGSNFGGLLTAAHGGGGTANGASQYTKALANAEKAARANPHDAALWLKAGEAAYQVATLPDVNYVTGSGYTSAGHVALNQLRSAWNRYLADAPASPDTYFAETVVAGFGLPPAEGGTGVGDYTTAESAQSVVAENQPTDTAYESLALYAWLAKDNTAGAQAAARAKALAPKKDLKTVTTTLTEYQSLARLTNGSASTGSSTSASGTTSSASSTPATSTSSSSSASTSSTSSKSS